VVERRYKMVEGRIKRAIFDGEVVYQVIEVVDGVDSSIEYTTNDIGSAEKYCENYYGVNWYE